MGTTDTDHPGGLDDPQTDEVDVEYVLRALNHSLTTTVTVDDVTGVWAGLRPLVRAADDGRTADLSRDGTASTIGRAGCSPSPAASSRPIARWPRTRSTP